ncbi:MAG: CdvA-like protein, partial [Candidatus Bathyarchaeota archaeon]
RKKKQALDNLYNSGKISVSTYDSIDNELCNVISDIEIRQKKLANALTSKVDDLEQQIGTLELFLANSEIQYVAGEIDEEIHANESSAFSTGLSSLKTQLAKLKEAVSILIPEESISEPSAEIEAEPIEIPENVVEETTEISTETFDNTPVEMPAIATIETPVEAPIETTIPESIES